MARQLSSVALIVLACGVLGTSVTASGNRRLLTLKGDHEATGAAEDRKLYINPNAKPASTSGWNVIISIICQGKWSTVNTIKLRSALESLGFPTDGQNFQFGGNAATTNWRSITTFVVNIPKATSSAQGLAAVAKVTSAALNKLAKLPSINAVLDVYLSPFKA